MEKGKKNTMSYVLSELAKKISAPLLREDAEVDFRIRTGIESNRKGFAHIRLTAPDGTPVSRAQVRYRQTTHHFRFGCNAFMFDQFPEKEQNDSYEETFASVFNQAVLPFYWADLEPNDGELRFAASSREIYRRPQPDKLLAFCRKHGISPKGHPLCWHSFHPSWMPGDDPDAYLARLARRIREIAERYGNAIRTWDVVNEAQTRTPLIRTNLPSMPEHYAEEAFKLADRAFPGAELIYNDDHKWWDYQGAYSQVYLLIRHFQEQHLPVRTLGLQFHLFDHLLDRAEQYLDPHKLFECFALYGKLGIPFNISEISIPGSDKFGDGDHFQELLVEKLYPLWFSCPNCNAITWWNLADGTGAGAPLGSLEGENSLKAGLVNFDFSRKPAFRTLDRLINREWRSAGEFEYDAEKENMFHGFHGVYDLEIRTDHGTFLRPRALELKPGINRRFDLSLRA